ncbi:hypothetical protein K7X08_016608 [Anisodus acutangulus]|uniref:Uncharacterized protein n=1 Tax=Anisodus acutangulus TaxID=402998 RepID=A0A9Q1LHM5_9SOLA|nr:hypothetical protein K7X08_016608 [Anisodus acutangulus]
MDGSAITANTYIMLIVCPSGKDAGSSLASRAFLLTTRLRICNLTAIPGKINLVKPYQGPVSSTQGYGASMPHQQQYPYTSSGQMQQTYPAYGSAPAADGHNHPQASGPGYPQQSAQPVAGYGQPVPQQPPSYAQAAPAGGYSSYPSQPAYTEQQATDSAGYGYQGPVDQTYSGAQASTTYSAPFAGQQAYAQPAPVPYTAPAQPGYDQSMTQPGGGFQGGVIS